MKNLRPWSWVMIPIAFFILGIFTLKDYGINWDTINHLPRGQAYLNYFLTGNKDFANIPGFFNGWQAKGQWYFQDPKSLRIDTNFPNNDIPRRSLYQIDSQNFNYYVNNDGDGHPPLSDIASSYFNHVLFQKLGIINDIDSYRVYGIFLAACLVGLIFYWVSKIYGTFAGLIASLSLAIYPLFFAESHFNTEKDIPETVYWSFLMFSVWRGITSKSWRWIIAAGVFFGLALGTKFNILFAGPVIILWLLVYLIDQYLNNGRPNLINKVRDNTRLILAGIAAPFIGLVIFIGLWPYLWQDIPLGLTKVFGFYKTIGTTTSIDSRFIWHFGLDIFPIKWIINTTPIVILFLSGVGIFYSLLFFKNEKNKTSLLFFLWLFIPIARVTMPGSDIYGGIRQIMEYIPAMAIFSGIGAMFFQKLVLTNFKILAYKNGILVSIAITLLFFPIIFKLIQIHPNENVYFNPIIGGLAGAKAKDFPFWGVSFGAPYRLGVEWLNDNALEGANVVFARELIPNIPRIWLRQDLNLFNGNRSGYLKKGEYVIGLSYQGSESTSYFDRYLDKELIPVHQILIDDVSVLNIWKNDKQHTKSQFLSEKKIDSIKLTKFDLGVEIDVGKVVSLSRLEADLDSSNCAKLVSAYSQLSTDRKSWQRLPGLMPNEDWSVPKLGNQPSENHVIIPFAGDEARFIQIVISPENACLSNLKNIRVYSF